jgi:hypothetical protein
MMHNFRLVTANVRIFLTEGNPVLEQLKEMMREMADDPELFDILAKCMMQMYEALIRAGFSPESAIQIVAAQGTGIKSN